MKIKNYRGYSVDQLNGSLRIISCLKNRYGVADIEIGVFFAGSMGVFRELPKPELIEDYNKYSNNDWLKE